MHIQDQEVDIIEDSKSGKHVTIAYTIPQLAAVMIEHN
jgi:hypothetical protein